MLYLKSILDSNTFHQIAQLTLLKILKREKFILSFFQILNSPGLQYECD